jgi:hypothetical protein
MDPNAVGRLVVVAGTRIARDIRIARRIHRDRAPDFTAGPAQPGEIQGE